MRNNNLSFKLPTSLSMDVLVLDHGAIMTHSNKLADKGDFVSVSREQVSPYVLYVPQIYASIILMQNQYGVLLSCFSTVHNNDQYCLLRRMEAVTTSRRPLETEFECPLFFLTSEVFTVRTNEILSPVSFVHVCEQTCQISSNSNGKLKMLHDLTNNLFCFNIFCTANYIK